LHTFRKIHAKTCTHENCLLDTDGHFMSISHHKCVSMHCCREDKDECPFQYQGRFCQKQQLYTIYSFGNHTNKYEQDAPIRERAHGVHPLMTKEIERLLNDNSSLMPSKILAILSKHKVDGKYDPAVPVPTLSQIQGHKGRERKKKREHEGEYANVEALVDAFKYKPELNDDQPFTFGTQLGEGTDNDHLRIGFTSRKLLHSFAKHPDKHAIYHVDGTYKLIRNRFPMGVFGRSDVNGQFHLIALCVLSHETEEDYRHFYWLVFIDYLFV
jgi:hypothetical protein